MHHQFCCYLPIKPVSVNQSNTIARGRIQKTHNYHSFMKHARELLLGYNLELARFVSHYKNQPITLRLVFHMPKNKLMTKNGLVSKTSSDVDNLVKPTVDMLFRRMEQMNKNINDARVVRMVTEKKVSRNDEYGITALVSFR